MKNVAKKNIITAVAVILISASIMLIPELIHAEMNFAVIDWQNVIVRSLVIDVSVYLGFVCASKNNADTNE